MATIKIDSFGGIAPRMHPTLLADGMARVAHNVKLKTGKLVPLRNPKKAEGIALVKENGLEDVEDAKSIHAWEKADGGIEFLLFPGVTWMAEGNIADDSRTRIVVSGETGATYYDTTGDGHADVPVVYMRDGAAIVRHHIIKRKLPAPQVSRTSAEALGEERRYTRFFLTWVDKYGYESPVSDASQVESEGVWVDGDLEYNDGDTVNVALAGGGRIADAEKVRIYKVVTGSEEGRIQFLKEVEGGAGAAIWSGGVSVQVKDEDAGEVLPEIEAPPYDLECIHDVPGGYYCGLSRSAKKTVFFSDIGLLYSWPVAYRYDVKDNVVALAVTSNTVFALTDGWPYVLTGTAPEAMTVAKLAGPAACVSRRGVCVYRNAVYYVSNLGLMTIYNSADAGTVCTNLTEKIFTKEQWTALNPASAVVGQHDGTLYLFFTLADGTGKALTISLLDDARVAVATNDETAACLCIDNKTDKMYFVREG